MPFKRVNIKEAIQEQLKKNPEFRAAWEHRDETRQKALEEERCELADYLNSLPPDKRESIETSRNAMLKNKEISHSR